MYVFERVSFFPLREVLIIARTSSHYHQQFHYLILDVGIFTQN